MSPPPPSPLPHFLCFPFHLSPYLVYPRLPLAQTHVLHVRWKIRPHPRCLDGLGASVASFHLPCRVWELSAQHGLGPVCWGF